MLGCKDRHPQNTKRKRIWEERGAFPTTSPANPGGAGGALQPLCGSHSAPAPPEQPCSWCGTPRRCFWGQKVKPQTVLTPQLEPETDPTALPRSLLADAARRQPGCRRTARVALANQERGSRRAQAGAIAKIAAVIPAPALRTAPRTHRCRLPWRGLAEHNGSERAQSCWSKYIIVAGEINNKQRSDYNRAV